MSIKSIDDLRAAFANNESSNENYPNNYYPFWLMNDGQQAIVRFLPDANEDNPMGFFVEKRMHNLNINGEKKSVPCLTMYGDDCPICKVSSNFYNKGDKDRGKDYWRKRQYLTQAIIVEDPLPADETTQETHQGKVRCLALGYQLYNIIKEATMSGHLDTIPYLFKDGVDFIIKKMKQGDYSTYALGSTFARQNRDLSDEEIALAQANMIDLSTLLPKAPTIENVNEMLSASLNGAAISSEMNAGAGSASPAASYSAENNQQPAADAGYQATDDGGAGGDEADNILAEIRNRKGKK